MEISQLIYFIFEMVGTVSFAVAGAMVAIKKKVDIFGVIVLSAFTALGGGIIRDVMLKEIPFVLTKRIYAIASICGGTAYHLLVVNSVDKKLAAVISVAIVFVIRVLATVLKLDLPRVKFDENR